MSSVKIASGHNNVAGLTELNALSGVLFADFATAGGVLTEYHDYESREFDGMHRAVAIGLPWVAWIFPRLSPAEMSYLLATFGDLVTIRTLDKSDMAYKNYNATFIQPDLVEDANWDMNYWYDARFEFRDLELIP